MQITKSQIAAASVMAIIACNPKESGSEYKRFRIGSSVQQRPQIDEMRSKKKTQRQAKKKGRK